MISNSGHDERGKYSGGQAGDQTGNEWQIRTWYNRPWNLVLRHPDKKVGKMIAEFGRAAANNDNIGYNQGDRLSFWKALENSNYNPANIKIKCNSDCSAGVTAIVKAVGHILKLPRLEELSPSNYTGSMRATFSKAGFAVLTDSKYLISDQYLIPGDILLNESHHTCINLDYGSKVHPYVGWVLDKKGWWYQLEDESYYNDGWHEINSKWYYFKEDGYIANDEYIKSSNYASDGRIYYVESSGEWDGHIYRWMQDAKGWWLAQVGGEWYAKNQWIKLNDKWYYFDGSGYMVTGRIEIDDKTYFFNEDGSLS